MISSIFAKAKGDSLFPDIKGFSLKDLWKGNTLSLGEINEGVEYLELYKDLLKEIGDISEDSKQYKELFKETFEGSSPAVKEATARFIDAQGSLEDLKNSADDLPDMFSQSATAASKFSTALQTVKVMAVAAIASFAIQFAVKQIASYIDSVVHYEEIQLEKLAELTDAYNEVKAESDAVQQELDSVNEKIDILNGKDSLTLVEQEELDKLRLQSIELENQIYLLEQKKQLAAEAAEAAAHQTVNSTTETSSHFKGAVGDEYGYVSLNTAGYKISKIDKLKENIEDMRSLYAEINTLNKEMNDGIRDGFEGRTYSSAEAYQKKIEELTGQYDDLKAESIELQSSLNEQAESFVGATEAGNADQLAIKAVSEELVQCLEDTTNATAATERFTAVLEEVDSALDKSNIRFGEHTKAASDWRDGLEKLWDIEHNQGSQNIGLGIKLTDYNELILTESRYKDCLESINGVMQINAEKARELALSMAEEEKASIKASKALDTQQYIKNQDEIVRLKNGLEQLKAAHSSSSMGIKEQISALEAENLALLDNIDGYDILIGEIEGATSAFQNWVNAQSEHSYGDMLSDTQEAYELMKETLTGTDAEIQGKVGEKTYKAAVELILPDDVDHEDQGAIKKYLNSVKGILGTEGPQLVDNVLRQFTKDGIVEVLDDGMMQIAEGLKIQDIMDSLHISESVAQALIEALKSYDIQIDVAQPIESMADLASAAAKAKNELMQLEDASGMEIQMYFDGIEDGQDKLDAMNATIREMQDLRAKLEVDSSEYEQAGLILQYVVAQKQLLEAPLILLVDTSQADEKFQEPLRLLQEFQQKSNELELQASLGLDTSAADAELQEMLEQIQSTVDGDLIEDIHVDTSSVEALQTSLKEITAEDLIVKCGLDASEVEQFEGDDHDLEPKVTYGCVHNEVDSFVASVQDIDRNVIYHVVTVGNIPTSAAASGLKGTTRAGGTAAYNGYDPIGEPVGGRMLVGELGREILVNPRTGVWHTVGDNGAEFVQVPKGSIIFNHEQTEELLGRGWVNSRGLARAYGSARAYSNSGVSSNKFSWTFGQGSSSSNKGSTNAAADAAAAQAAAEKEAARLAKEAEQAAKDAEKATKDSAKAANDALKDEKEALEDLKDIYDAVLDAAEDALDAEIERLKTMYDKQKELLEEQQDDLDDALSGILWLIDQEIEKLEKAQDALDDSYSPQIDSIRLQIEALKERNEEEQEALDLQKKKDALARAQSQRTIRVYKEGEGFVWETDTSAINDAQEALNEALYNKQISDLEKQQQALEDELEQKKQELQEQIDANKDYKDEWNNLQDVFQNEANVELLRKLYGDEFIKAIQQLDSAALDRYGQDYYDNQKAQSDLDAKIKENEAQIERLEELQDLWKEIADSNEKAQNRIYAANMLGADWEKDVLNGRLETMRRFQEEYNKLLNQISAKEAQIDGKALPVAPNIMGNAKGTRSVGRTGISAVDEVGPEIVVRPGNGRYTMLEVGDGVLPANLTNTLFNAAISPERLKNSIVQKAASEVAPLYQASRSDCYTIDIGGITMYGVNDVESFGRVLQQKSGTVVRQIFAKRQ